MIRRILAAVDDSPAGLRAARDAIDLAVLAHASLRVVHVVAEAAETPPSTTGSPGASGQELLDYVLRFAEPVGVNAQSFLLHGYPGEQILRAAREWSADMIVIGRRDTGGAGEPYVGGETREVLEFSECPVLVVPRRLG